MLKEHSVFVTSKKNYRTSSGKMFKIVTKLFGYKFVKHDNLPEFKNMFTRSK